MMELDDGSGAVIDVIYRKEQPIPAVFSVTPGDVDRAAGKNISARNAATPAGTVGTSLVEHDTRSWSPEQEAQVTTPGPQGLDMTGFKVGKVVKVKGTVSVFRGSRQIDLKRLSMDTPVQVKGFFVCILPLVTLLAILAHCWLHL